MGGKVRVNLSEEGRVFKEIGLRDCHGLARSDYSGLFQTHLDRPGQENSAQKICLPHENISKWFDEHKFAPSCGQRCFGVSDVGSRLWTNNKTQQQQRRGTERDSIVESKAGGIWICIVCDSTWDQYQCCPLAKNKARSHRDQRANAHSILLVFLIFDTTWWNLRQMSKYLER